MYTARQALGRLNMDGVGATCGPTEKARFHIWWMWVVGARFTYFWRPRVKKPKVKHTKVVARAFRVALHWEAVISEGTKELARVSDTSEALLYRKILKRYPGAQIIHKEFNPYAE